MVVKQVGSWGCKAKKFYVTLISEDSLRCVGKVFENGKESFFMSRKIRFEEHDSFKLKQKPN